LAYTGEAGLELWNVRWHELVLLDLMLPGIKGDEVLKAILAVNPAQPVIIITAYGSLDRHQSLMLDGAVDFLPKPYKVMQLRQACERALRHKEFVETRVQVQAVEVEGTMHQLADRVQAAEECLSVGRTGMAFEHLKNALAFCRDMTSNDDE
jgi:DNA-binding NtrC family response regulator